MLTSKLLRCVSQRTHFACFGSNKNSIAFALRIVSSFSTTKTERSDLKVKIHSIPYKNGVVVGTDPKTTGVLTDTELDMFKSDSISLSEYPISKEKFLEAVHPLVKDQISLELFKQSCGFGEFNRRANLRSRSRMDLINPEHGIFITYPQHPDKDFELPERKHPITNETPIILLDIDGIVNNGCEDDDTCKFDNVFVPFRMERFTVKWSPKINQKINSWNEIGEVRFLTSWGLDAIYCLSRVVGLLPFQYSNVAKVKPQEWGAFLDRPIVWIDDELEPKCCLGLEKEKLENGLAKNKFLPIHELSKEGIEKVDRFLSDYKPKL